MRVRYSEIFFSFQGEAELAGIPAVWLRFFGCNLNCNGFGQTDPTDPSTYELPYQDYDLGEVKNITELPVWTTGCDSSYSWSAKYKHLANDASIAEVCDRLVEANKSTHNPEGLFIHPVTRQPIMLCFTGGEPMLQQNAMVEILRELNNRGNMPTIVTVETNATRPISDDLRNFIRNEFHDKGGIRWHFAMSPKLFTVSGEKDVVDYDKIHDYAFVDRRSTSVLKFVCNGTNENWEELDKHLEGLYNRFDPLDAVPSMWIMPVGATKEAQESDDIADICMEAMNRGFKVATRNHCYVFGNVIGK